MDRGLIKWNGFFMPEHKELLKQTYIEDLKTEKPALDEEQLHAMNDLFVMSIQDNEQLELTLWLDGFIELIRPVIIQKIDPYQRKLYVLYKGSKHYFHFDSLIEAKRI